MAMFMPTYPNIINPDQIADLRNVISEAWDELQWVLLHLDEKNVESARSVKAQNIDTRQAKITNAQIDSLNAKKIKTGTLDTEKVTISSSNGTLLLDGDNFYMYDENNVLRLHYGIDENGQFGFIIYDKNSSPTIYLDDTGQAVFTGEIRGGKITSDTSIDVTTDVNVGNEIFLNTSNQFNGVVWKSKSGDVRGRIEIDPLNGTMFINADDVIKANGKNIATCENDQKLSIRLSEDLKRFAVHLDGKHIGHVELIK